MCILPISKMISIRRMQIVFAMYCFKETKYLSEFRNVFLSIIIIGQSPFFDLLFI